MLCTRLSTAGLTSPTTSANDRDEFRNASPGRRPARTSPGWLCGSSTSTTTAPPAFEKLTSSFIWLSSRHPWTRPRLEALAPARPTVQVPLIKALIHHAGLVCGLTRRDSGSLKDGSPRSPRTPVGSVALVGPAPHDTLGKSAPSP